MTNNKPKKIEVAVGVIHTPNGYILQRRPSEKSIGAAGLIGCFGGKIKGNETKEAAVIRELAEETYLTYKKGELEYMGHVTVMSDRDNKPVEVKAHAFSGSAMNQVACKEGTLVVLTYEQIMSRTNELTPATLAIFQDLIEIEEKQ